MPASESRQEPEKSDMLGTGAGAGDWAESTQELPVGTRNPPWVPKHSITTADEAKLEHSYGATVRVPELDPHPSPHKATALMS